MCAVLHTCAYKHFSSSYFHKLSACQATSSLEKQLQSALQKTNKAPIITLLLGLYSPRDLHEAKCINNNINRPRHIQYVYLFTFAFAAAFFLLLYESVTDRMKQKKNCISIHQRYHFISHLPHQGCSLLRRFVIGNVWGGWVIIHSYNGDHFGRLILVLRYCAIIVGRPFLG